MPELLEKLGVKKFEMLMGLFYNIKGSQAEIDDDRKDGFYSESRSLVDKYGKEHSSIGCDSEELKIDFEKDKIKFIIQTVYGSDSTKRFTAGKLTLDDVFKNVFPKSWDDIWLALNTGINQRHILLEHKINHITEIRRIYKINLDFKKELMKFKSDSANSILIKNVVSMMQKNMNTKLHQSSDQDVADCLYLYSGFVK